MIDPVIKELLQNTAATNVAYNDACRAALEQGVLIGLREGMAKLDRAWAEINAGKFVLNPTPVFNQGFNAGSRAALEIIEKLGGMDPLKRRTP